MGMFSLAAGWSQSTEERGARAICRRALECERESSGAGPTGAAAGTLLSDLISQAHMKGSTVVSTSVLGGYCC